MGEAAHVMTLYEITERLASLLDVEEITDEMLLEIDSLGFSLEAKVADYAGLIEKWEDEAEALGNRAKLITNRSRSLKNKAQRLRDNLRKGMELANVYQVKVGTHKVSLRANPPSVQIEEGAELPERFLVPQPPVPDKNALKAALKGGEEIEGVSLVSTSRLVIE
jgi:hypothetical protein